MIRRHHCRTCGKIFCGKCSNLKTLVKFDNYKEPHRVCKICFNFLTKETALKQIAAAYVKEKEEEKKSDELIFVDKTVQSSSNNDDGELLLKINNDDNRFKEELKEVILRKNSSSTTTATINDTSSTTTTTTDTNDDEEEGEEEEKKDFNKIKETFIKNEIKQNINKKYSKSSITSSDERKRSITSNTSLNNIQQQTNVLFSDSVLISKMNLNRLDNEPQEEDDKTSMTVTSNKIWERKWIQLTDDRLLSVYSCQNDLKSNESPKDLLNLNYFELININETTFELKRDDSLQQSNKKTTNRIKTKSFINLFEYTNYELKFLKDENKTILFNLIKDLISAKR